MPKVIVPTAEKVLQIQKDGLHIGLMDFGVSLEENFKYSSDRSLHDFDLIIWKLGSHTLSTFPTTQFDNRTLSTDGGHQFKICKARREKDFAEFFQKGGMLVVFSPDSFSFSYHGHLSQTLHSIIPGEPKFSIGSGEKIDFKGDEILRPFWEGQKQNFIYQGTYPSPVGKGFVWARNTNSAVGFFQKRENGYLLVLPSLSFTPSLSENASILRLGKVITDVKIFYQSLNQGKDERPAPSWAVQFRLPGEDLVIEDMKNQKANIEELQRRLEKTAISLRELQRQKILLYGTGQVLTDQVLAGLKELGIETVEGPTGRDDLILKYKDYVGVVEVKGVKGSAGEKYAAQLEKWASRYFIENEVHPKPFLFVNAFNEIDPPNRTKEVPFPNQMLEYSKSRNQCLATTSQLLAMVIISRKEPEKRDSFVEMMFNTVGTISGFNINEASNISADSPVKP